MEGGVGVSSLVIQSLVMEGAVLVEAGRRQVEKLKNSRFGGRGHPNHWEAAGSKAKKTALGGD